MTTIVNSNLIGDGFVLDTGDTMTGDLTLLVASHADLNIKTSVDTSLARLLLANTADDTGYQMYLSNSGGFALVQTDSSGIGTADPEVFTVTGRQLTFDLNPLSIDTQSASVNALTRKDYVDDTTVSLSGDTMTGDLLINHGTTPILTLKPASASGFPGIKFKDSSDDIRGSLHLNEATGGMAIVEYSAIGAVETQLEFTTDGNVTVNGTAPTADAQLTRKDYVDGKVVILTTPEILTTTAPSHDTWTSTSVLASTTLTNAQATAAIIKVSGTNTWSTTTWHRVNIYACDGDATPTKTPLYVVSSGSSMADGTSRALLTSTAAEATISLNGSYDFKYATWCDEGAAIDTFYLVLVGYYT